ncbi:Cullin-domain-containing protein [Tilletiaria anomala UBC 951]|uniref:Cullin-domain-containing protein n=1 Tax=Tilletiaria anomala (strain ATCC 24038 / CBS 436.72 / UBC 951) TaxID=1037660 RepID=A0A066WF59_TILAU|nr:Cullin-domain-containing protein [Tilletiaria anomala UBC 951]KDN52391.1 Cullin-domain-containing protein [Tilletiaria anomala UBC 951]
MAMQGGSAARRPATKGGKLRAPKRAGLELSTPEMWERLSRAVHEIYNHNSSLLSFEENFRYAYNFVLHNQGDMLYSGIIKLLEEHLSKQCQERIVPTFPAGSMLSLPPGIIMPKGVSASRQLSSQTSLASAKGKGKARAVEELEVDSDDDDNRRSAQTEGRRSESLGNDTNEGSTTTLTGGQSVGDRTDAAARAQAGERLLKTIRDVWEDYCACTHTLSKVLNYVDRVYVPEKGRLPSWKLGLELFRDNVPWSQKYPIHRNLYGTLLTQIQIEREGSVINRSAVKSCIEMLVTLSYPHRNVPIVQRRSVYKQEFEPAFLSTSVEFYRSEAERKLASGDAAEYLRHVERRFLEEEDRVTVYLNSSTGKDLRLLLERYLLSDHLQTIIDMPGSGIFTMLDEPRDADLERMYRLFRRVGQGIPVLRQGLKGYITAKGALINEAINNIEAAGSKAPKPAVERVIAKGIAVTAAGGPEGDENGEGSEECAKGKGKDPATAGKKNAGAVTAGEGGNASSLQASLALRWVEQVLAFKARFDSLLKQAFASDTQCEGAISEAFEHFINKCPRAPEFISLFIDENLKKGLKGKTEEEVDEVLERTIVIFRFLNNKDVFERYYKTHLAKRLLGARSVSDDAERSMMAKLKVECGHNYVHKLQGMLNDMKLSDEANSAFTKRQQTGANSTPFDLSVNVLTATFWPSVSVQDQSVVWPEQMQSAIKTFEQYYHSLHSGRRLTWQANLGTADVRVTFKTRKHELNVSTYALMALLLFEDLDAEESLTYTDIRTSTNIAEAELKRALQSLACAKYKVLLKEPKGRDVNETDKFYFNINFTAPLARIKIAQIVARVETQQERKETNEKILEERAHLTDACIVRIMKNRKRLAHSELVLEVIKQLSTRFHPSPADVKKRIESLIDRVSPCSRRALSPFNYS